MSRWSCPDPGSHRRSVDPRSIRPDSVLELLVQLVNKSLVLAEAHAGEQRYRLLETIRQYALERLSESGEVEEIRRRHAAFVLALTERAERELRGPHEREWSARLEAEHSNVRAALRWAIDRDEAELGVRLCGDPK